MAARNNNYGGKMKKLSGILTILLVLIFVMQLLGGCTVETEPAGETTLVPEQTTSAPEQTAPSEPEKTTEAAPATRTIVDSLGRTVEIPKEVTRIVSLNVITTEIICVLGAKDKIVGVCEWIKRGTGYGELVVRMNPELQDYPSPGGGPKPVNVEEIYALEPDVVLVSGVGTDWVDDLEEFGIPVIAAEFETVATVMDDIQLVAEIVGKEKEGEELVSYLEGYISFVQERVADVSPEDQVAVAYVSLRDGVYSAYGNGTFQDGQMTTAGGINIAADLTAVGEQSHMLTLSPEQFIVADPQVIVTHHGTSAAEVLKDETITGIDAITNKKVYTLPEWAWDFGSLRTIFCIEWLGTKLYPDEFRDIDIDAEAEEFFQHVYNISYTGPILAEYRDIEDMGGVTVTIPGQVNRVVAAYPMATQLIYAINGQTKMVGATFNHSSETYDLYVRMDPANADITDLGHPNNVNIEEVLALNPDVVFSSTYSGLNEQLEELGIPVVRIYVETPELVVEGAELIGDILGNKSEAQTFAEYYNGTVDYLSDKLGSIPEEDKPRVYVAGWDKLKSAAGDWYQNCVVEAAGGVSYSRALPSGGWQTVLLEEIIAWNPDVIFCAIPVDDFFSDSQWEGVNAVKNQKVYKIPSLIQQWDLPIPESILGMLWEADKLYGETAGIDIAEEIREFYSTLYRYEITDEEVDALLGQ
jgi:iron complex transport system substrate-binding protein